MTEISLDRRVSVSEDAVFRELDGEAVILHLEAGVYFGLDPIGTRLWQLMDTEGSLRRVVDAALLELDVDRATLERDLLELVAQLEDKRLIVVS